MLQISNPVSIEVKEKGSETVHSFSCKTMSEGEFFFNILCKSAELDGIKMYMNGMIVAYRGCYA